MSNGTGQQPAGNIGAPIIIFAAALIGGGIGGYLGAQAGSDSDDDTAAVQQEQPQDNGQG